LCAAFKALVMWHSMTTSSSDYVMWADAKRFELSTTFKTPWGGYATDITLNVSAVNVRQAVSALNKRRVPHASAYGLAGCSSVYADVLWLNGGGNGTYLGTGYISEFTSNGFSHLVTDYQRFITRPHAITSHLLLKNNEFNRRLMWDWLNMAIAHPEAFCATQDQDQTAFNFLLYNRSLPILNACPFVQPPANFAWVHSLTGFLSSISQGNFVQI